MSIFEKFPPGSNKKELGYREKLNEINQEIKEHPQSKTKDFGYFFKYADHSEPGRFFVDKLKDISKITKKHLKEKIKQEKQTYSGKEPFSKLRLKEKISRLKLDIKHGFSEKYNQMQVLKEQNALPGFAKKILEMKEFPSVGSKNQFTFEDIEKKAEMFAGELFENDQKNYRYKRRAKQDYINQIKFVLKLKMIDSLGKNDEYDLLNKKIPREGLGEQKFNQIKELLIANEVGSFDEDYKVDPMFANAALKNPDLFYENLMKQEKNDIKRARILINNGSKLALDFLKRHPVTACVAISFLAPAIIYAHAKLFDDPSKEGIIKKPSDAPKQASQNLSAEQLQELRTKSSPQKPIEAENNPKDQTSVDPEQKTEPLSQETMTKEEQPPKAERTETKTESEAEKPIEAQNKEKKPESKKMTWDEIVDYLKEKVGLDLSKKTPDTRRLYNALKTGKYKITGAKKLGEDTFWIILTNKENQEELNIAFNQGGGRGEEGGSFGGSRTEEQESQIDIFQAGEGQTQKEFQTYIEDPDIDPTVKRRLQHLYRNNPGYLPPLDRFDYEIKNRGKVYFTDKNNPHNKMIVVGNRILFYKDGTENPISALYKKNKIILSQREDSINHEAIIPDNTLPDDLKRALTDYAD